jgi:hypothetical protein
MCKVADDYLGVRFIRLPGGDELIGELGGLTTGRENARVKL